MIVSDNPTTKKATAPAAIKKTNNPDDITLFFDYSDSNLYKVRTNAAKNQQYFVRRIEKRDFVRKVISLYIVII